MSRFSFSTSAPHQPHEPPLCTLRATGRDGALVRNQGAFERGRRFQALLKVRQTEQAPEDTSCRCLLQGAWRTALGAQRSALGARRTALGARRSAHSARRTALGAQRSAHSRSAFGARRSAHSARRIALGAQRSRSALGARRSLESSALDQALKRIRPGRYQHAHFELREQALLVACRPVTGVHDREARTG
jgi:hypothetical protein